MVLSTLSSRHQTIFARLTPQIVAGIAEAVEQGRIAPYIGRTVSLSEAIAAITELEKTGLPPGKLVVIPAGATKTQCT